MRNDKFTLVLHRRAILRGLARVLLDQYIVSDGNAKQQFLCEEASYQDRFASQESLSQVLAYLSALEDEETKRLLRFEIREREDVQLPDSLKETEEDDGEEKAARRASRRRRGGGSGSPPAPAT